MYGWVGVSVGLWVCRPFDPNNLSHHAQAEIQINSAIMFVHSTTHPFGCWHIHVSCVLFTVHCPLSTVLLSEEEASWVSCFVHF